MKRIVNKIIERLFKKSITTSEAKAELIEAGVNPDKAEYIIAELSTITITISVKGGETKTIKLI